jgi:hypothetical protein
MKELSGLNVRLKMRLIELNEVIKEITNQSGEDSARVKVGKLLEENDQLRH